MSLIYLVSDRPDIPSAPAPLWDFLIKKSLHALAYAILTALWWWALKPEDTVETGEGPRRRALLTAFLITLVWAASDEWHQTFVPGRSGRIRDVWIDGAGALAAAAWIRRGLGAGRGLDPRGRGAVRTPRSPDARPSPAPGSADPPA